MYRQAVLLPALPTWIFLPPPCPGKPEASGHHFPWAGCCQQEENRAESQREVRAKSQVSGGQVQQRGKSKQQGRAALLHPSPSKGSDTRCPQLPGPPYLLPTAPLQAEARSLVRRHPWQNTQLPESCFPARGITLLECRDLTPHF